MLNIKFICTIRWATPSQSYAKNAISRNKKRHIARPDSTQLSSV